jgi:uncharacterized membrane protein
MPARSGGHRLGHGSLVFTRLGRGAFIRRAARSLSWRFAIISSRTFRVGWLLPAGLIALGAIPVAAGGVRLAGGGPITPENARFFAAPVPVVLHLISAVLFCVVGAFQFAPAFRRRRPGWHRAAGRLLMVCGLVAGLSGLWMTHFYPPVENDGELLYGFRLLFGLAMVACIVLALVAVRGRDIGQHRAWITRGYAIGLGAGTQALVHLPWLLVLGKPGELGRALLYETQLRTCSDSRPPPAGPPR